MAEPTVTRETLRRRIGRGLRLQFYLRYPDGSVAITASTGTTTISATGLTQDSDFWLGGYAYIASSAGSALGEERKITSFSSGKIVLEHPLSIAPTAGDELEIVDMYTPALIHDAINRAIREGGKHFPDVIMNDTDLIFKEDTLTYYTSDLTTAPWRIQQVWTEQNTISEIGVATADTSTGDAPTRLLDTDKSWGDDTFNAFFISLYDGTGAGQLRTISDVIDSDDSIVIDSGTPWITNPDATSKYRIWDPNNQEIDWDRRLAIRTDAIEDPNIIYVNALAEEWLGYRMRVIYLARPAALDADSDETVVPADYVFHMSMAYLFEGLMTDNRSEARRYADMADMHRDLAEEYRTKNEPQVPYATLWQEDEYGVQGTQTGRSSIIGNPLDWRR